MEEEGEERAFFAKRNGLFVKWITVLRSKPDRGRQLCHERDAFGKPGGMVRAAQGIWFLVLLDFGFAQSEMEKGVMLPSPVRVTGEVRDEGGRPLADVWINHTGVHIENVRTDSQGRFDIETRAPAIVFRKDGFQSRYLRVSGGGQELAITLSGPTPRMKECGAYSGCTSLKGGRSIFCLPEIREVKVTKQRNDVDYGWRWYGIKARNGKVGVQHGSGGMWGPGLPSDEDVWSARDYTERAYRDREGFAIIDARGRSPEGKCWRVVGRAFETASYRNIPEGDTGLLDRLLDGVCVNTGAAWYKSSQRR
jgi:hypothetical protein